MTVEDMHNAAAIHAMSLSWWRRFIVRFLGTRVTRQTVEGIVEYREWRGVRYLWGFERTTHD